MADWSAYKKTDKESKEIDEAFEFARNVDKPTKAEQKSISPVRGKKAKAYGASVLPPLDGATQEESDIIREFVALDLAGYSVAAAAEKAGVTTNKIEYLKRSRPKAIEEAEREIVVASQRRYHRNLWVVRTALTEAGPRAVRTLVNLMDDINVPANHRVNAAIAVLKMIDVDGSASTGNESLKNEIASAIRDAREEIKSERIVDADDAEVIEDGDAGD